MTQVTTGTDERRQQILDAAAALITRQGYDKTSMMDVAAEAGISRGTIYLYYANKEALFEALIFRESSLYVEAWLDYLESNPSVTSIGAIYRGILHAISSRPFMAAMFKRDRRIIGSYLRKSGNLFSSLQSVSVWSDLLPALQQVGGMRTDVDAAIVTQVMDTFAYGLVSADDFTTSNAASSFDSTLTLFANMLDCWLVPPDGGAQDASRRVILARAAAFRSVFEKFKLQSDKAATS